MDKVLNRPLFRKEALRRGALKPIKAFDGRFIGPQQFRPPAVIPTPAVQAPGTGTQLMNVRQPGMFQNLLSQGRKGLGSLYRYGFSIPAFVGYDLTGRFIESQNPNVSPTNKMIGSGIGGTAAALAAGRVAPAALGLGFGPGLLALGLIGTGDYLVREGIKERRRIKAMTPEERKRFSQENRARAFDIMGDVSDRDFFGDFKPRPVDLKESAVPKNIQSPQGRPSSKVVTEKTDVATLPQNTTEIGKQKTIDTAKIAQNAITPNPQLDFPVQPPQQPQQPEANVLTIGELEKKAKEQKTKLTGSTADLDSIRANSPLMEQLQLARQIRDELSKGKSSQAKLVFLSNLASGLLTGTTKKAGIGGALEVFGQALGPAVNNMVMVKMKEDEVEQQLMGRALEFSTDFLKAQNEAYEMPEVEEVGVIQQTNSAGRTVNRPGRILKDGTKQVADGIDRRTGLTIFRTVDPNLNFIPNDDQNKETLDLAKQIAGKYAAVNLINRSLGIIAEGKAKAGVTGAVGLYGGRLTEALGDVLDFVKIGGDDIDVMNSQGKTMFEAQTLKAAADLAAMEPERFKSVQAARTFLEDKRKGIGKYKDFKGSALKDAQKRLEGGSKLDYERLAINETVLVYKLANSLKSKDRLTQKDIEMAKSLVKVFPLLRGDKNVRASLIAVAETILDDIKQQERLYERAGGSSQYLLDERKAYDLVSPGTTLNTFTETYDKFKKTEDAINKLTEEELKIIFPGLQLKKDKAVDTEMAP